MKICQFCAEEIQDAAIVCKHCGRNLTGPAAGAVMHAERPSKWPLIRIVAIIVLMGCIGLTMLVILSKFVDTVHAVLP